MLSRNRPFMAFTSYTYKCPTYLWLYKKKESSLGNRLLICSHRFWKLGIKAICCMRNTFF